MSGFAVLLLPDGGVPDPGTTAALCAALAVTGPDRQAHRTIGRATLLHSLLAVTPEEAGDIQPATLDENCWLVGDLRLDGREELVSLLRQHGRHVGTDMPDSLLVLHAHAVWGEDCVNRLIGDFTFAIWNASSRRLFAARDQLGATTLNHARAGNAIIVSNGIRPLLALPGVDRRADMQFIGDVLVTGLGQDPARTAFRGIERVPAAHSLTWEASKLSVRQYWQIGATHEEGKLSSADRVARLDAVLARAVADRTRAGKVAISLSGGLDSNLIAGFARRARPDAPLMALSMGCDWLVPDVEREYARLTAEHLRLDFHPLAIDGYLLDPPGGHWYLTPEPRYTFRQTGAALAGDVLLASGTRLVLNGIGGDQIGGGTASHWADLLAGGHLLRFARDARRYHRRMGRLLPLRASLAARMRTGSHAPVPLWDWIRPEFARTWHLSERLETLRRDEATTDPRLELVAKAIWPELLAMGAPEHTGAPIKSVSPFLDIRVLEEALTVPQIPWRTGKLILRQIARPMLPLSVVRRPKEHYGRYLPGEVWQARGIEPCREILAEPGFIDEMVYRDRIVARIEGVDTMGCREYSEGASRVSGLALWHRQWAEGAD